MDQRGMRGKPSDSGKAKIFDFFKNDEKNIQDMRKTLPDIKNKVQGAIGDISRLKNRNNYFEDYRDVYKLMDDVGKIKKWLRKYGKHLGLSDDGYEKMRAGYKDAKAIFLASTGDSDDIRKEQIRDVVENAHIFLQRADAKLKGGNQIDV